VYQVMIRPRIGDFLYSEEEFRVMLEDVAIFKQYNISGFVAGFLTQEGDVDISRTVRSVPVLSRILSIVLNSNRFVQAVSPLECQFFWLE
jgi:copper homeostasis protein CutC